MATESEIMAEWIIIRDSLRLAMTGWAGSNPVELTIRGRSRVIEKPTEYMDWLNKEIDRLERRTTTTSGSARNFVAIRRGL